MAACRALLVLLLAVSPGLACYPSPYLMLCWDMQDGTALNVKDSAGSIFSANGTMTGTVAWVPAQKPRGLAFTRQSSNTFVDPGDWMVSFPGAGGNDVRTGADVPQFAFAGQVPFEVGITLAASTLVPAAHSELVANATAGEGWAIYYDTNRHFIFYILGVATYDFGSGDATDNGILLQDLNPHRVFFARNATHIYCFVDGKRIGDSTLTPGTIVTGSNALSVGGNQAQNNFVGKASRLAIYNFAWTTITEIEAFARNDYLYWQGLQAPRDEEEK